MVIDAQRPIAQRSGGVYHGSLLKLPNDKCAVTLPTQPRQRPDFCLKTDVGSARRLAEHKSHRGTSGGSLANGQATSYAPLTQES